MQIAVPKGDEFIDDVVRHCYEEFGEFGDGDLTEDKSREIVRRMTRPKFSRSALYLMDDDKLAGFALFNSYYNLYTIGRAERIFKIGSLHFAASKAVNAGEGFPQEMDDELEKFIQKYEGCRDVEPGFISFPHNIDRISIDDYNLTHLVVHPDYRGKGHGSSLVKELCNRLAKRGVERIFSHAANRASEHVHENAGFERICYLQPNYANGGGATFMGCDLTKVIRDE